MCEAEQRVAAAALRAAAAAIWSSDVDEEVQHPDRDAERHPDQQPGDQVALQAARQCERGYVAAGRGGCRRSRVFALSAPAVGLGRPRPPWPPRRLAACRRLAVAASGFVLAAGFAAGP